MITTEQQRQCPICNHVVTLRGLHGHLRLKHHKEAEEIMALVNQAPLDRGGAVEEILNSLDLLKHLNERWDWIQILYERGCLESEGLYSDISDAFYKEEQEIRSRLAERGMSLEDADMEAYCSMPRLEQEEQEEEEEEAEDHEDSRA